MPLTVRKAMFSDANALAEINAASWVAAYSGIIPDEAIAANNAKRLDDWRGTLSGEHGAYVALIGESPVGFSMTGLDRSEESPDCAEIFGFYLHPDYWRLGYGSRLMQATLNALREQGYKSVRLWTLAENDRARRFYEKCGFEFDGSVKEITVGKQLDEVRYVRSL